MRQHTFWTLGTCFFMAALTGKAQPITVFVFDHAHVNPLVLKEADDEAGRVLRKAGVEINWVQCAKRLDGQGGCPTDLRPTELALDIFPNASTRSHISPTALGFALARGRGPFASEAVVFYDRVANLSSATISPSLMLGYAMAHEIGHLLLENGRHSMRGIMQPRWRHAQMVEAAQGLLMFLKEESGLIRENVQRRHQTMPNPQLASLPLVSRAAPELR